MIVTSTKLQLLVVIPDPSSDRGRLVEIERCARDGSQLPGWNQTLVDGGELAGLDHQFVPQDVAGSSIFQVEVGMVSKIDNGRLIRLGGVLRVLTTSNRKPPLRRSDKQTDNTMCSPFTLEAPGSNLSPRGPGRYLLLGVVVGDGVEWTAKGASELFSLNPLMFTWVY